MTIIVIYSYIHLFTRTESVKYNSTKMSDIICYFLIESNKAGCVLNTRNQGDV